MLRNVTLSTLFVCLVLGPVQGQDKLEITSPRATFGHLGAVRPKGKGILPGDVAHFSFEVKNLSHDAKGQASYSIAIEIYDGAGNPFYKQEPYNAVAQNFFGGSSLPCSASVEIPLNAKPGTYTWRVTLKDRLNKASATLNGEGQVLNPDFGLVRLATCADAEGKVPVHPVGVVGGTLYLNFAAVGFARDPKTKQPDLAVTMTILDEAGKVASVKEITGHVKSNIPESLQIIPLVYGLALNRPGRFTVQLTANCVLSKKSTTVSIPVRILPIE